MKMKLGALLALFALVLTGCATAAPAPDEAALAYAQGSTRNTEFKHCVEPGERDWSFPTHGYYTYPAGQRTWDFSHGEGADSGPFTVVTKDAIVMAVEGVATFTLNTECETLRAFHEQIGIKFDAWTSDGWDRMLDVYVKQPLEKALDAASKEYGYKALFTDAGVKDKWEERVQQLTASEVSSLGGAEFLTNFALTLQTPTPPDEIQAALRQEQQAVAENAAQAKRNETVRTELEAIREQVEVLGAEGYILQQAIKDGRVSLVLVPQGTGVNVNQ